MDTQNDTEAFSVLQSLESIVALTPDGSQEALELLKLSNGKNEEDSSPVMNSCLLLVENKMGSDGSEHNRNHLSEKIETGPERISSDEEHFPLLCKTKCTLNELHLLDTSASLEETNSAKGRSVNRDTSFCTDELFVQSEVVQVMEQQPSLRSRVPGNPPEHYPAVSEKEINPQERMLPGQDFKEGIITEHGSEWMSNSHSARAERDASSDEEDIYGHGLIYSSSETNVTEMGACHLPRDKVRSNVEKEMLSKSDQVCFGEYHCDTSV